MKKMRIIRSVAAGTLVLGLAFAGTVAAQCTNDGTLSAAGSVVGDTCGDNPTLGSICTGGNVTNGAGTSVVQLNLTGTPNFGLRVTSTTTGFNPELAFTSGACSSLSGCTVDDTNNSQVVPAAAAGTAYVPDNNFDGPNPQPGAGTGFVFITDLNTEAPGCGAYTLDVVGVLPVQLKDFTVN
jgi:hypothetical protein